MATLSDTAVKWAAGRGISRSTLEHVGATSGTTGMPGAGECEVIAFPYRRNGEIVNVKYRALAEKAFKQREGGEQRFWNLDAVLRVESERVYVVEGEMDALALLEAGVPAEEVVSVPNGAPERSSTVPEESDRYRYVDAGLEGERQRNPLVAFVGPNRCRVDFVDELDSDASTGSGRE